MKAGNKLKVPGAFSLFDLPLQPGNLSFHLLASQPLQTTGDLLLISLHKNGFADPILLAVPG